MSSKVVKRVKRMIAKFAYDAQNDGDVSIRIGETMYMQNTLEEAESSGWAIVVKNDDTEGSVPYSYLQVAPPPPPPNVSSGESTFNSKTTTRSVSSNESQSSSGSRSPRDKYGKSSNPDNSNEILKQKDAEIRKIQIEKEAGIKHLQMEKDAEIGELLERLKVYEKKFNTPSTIPNDSKMERDDILARLKDFEEREKKSEHNKNPYSQIHFIKHPNKAGFSVEGLNVRFNADGNSKTLFFDKAINEGIWKLSLIIEGYGGTDFAVGVTRVKDVKSTMVTLIGSQAGTGVALRQSTMASYIGNNDGSVSERLVPKDDTRALNGGCVSLEVNTRKHTMHIFNNGKQLNYYITSIPSFVLFGFGSAGMHTVKFVSLDEMYEPSVDDTIDRVAIRWAD